MRPPRSAAGDVAERPPGGEPTDAMAMVLARARIDAEFRRGLLSDPRTVIFEAFGVRIPEQFRLRFIEREADVDALVVLPDFRDASMELSEHDLEQVVGGAHAQNAHLAWKSAPPPLSPRYRAP